MPKQRRPSAELYLQKTLVAPKRVLFGDEMIYPSSAPIGEVECEMPGIVIYDGDHFKACYAYECVSYIPSSLNEQDYDNEDWKRIQQAQWNLLTGFVMVSKVDDSSLDIDDFGVINGSESYSLYYPSSLNGVLIEDGNTMFPDYREIILTETPFSAQGIFTMLHEHGHAVDEQTNPEAYRNVRRIMKACERGEKGALSVVMRSERNAWAHALKILKPFLSDDPEAELSLLRFTNLIHHDSLQSYRDGIKETISDRNRLLAGLAVSDADWYH